MAGPLSISGAMSLGLGGPRHTAAPPPTPYDDAISDYTNPPTGDLAAGDTPPVSDPYSVVVRFTLNASPTGFQYVWSSESALNQGIYIRYDSSLTRIQIRHGSSARNVTVSGLGPFTVGVVLDGANWSGYVDGVLAGTDTRTAVTHATPEVGRRAYDDALTLNGTVQRATHWARALTVGEIAEVSA